MHAFALLAFGGLVIALVVRMLSTYGRDMANRASNIMVSAGLGVGYAYLTDYSIFTAWDIGVRSHTVGAIVTGFMVAGFAWLWEEAFDFLHNYGHSEAPKKLRRAA